MVTARAGVSGFSSLMLMAKINESSSSTLPPYRPYPLPLELRLISEARSPALGDPPLVVLEPSPPEDGWRRIERVREGASARVEATGGGEGSSSKWPVPGKLELAEISP